MNSIHPEKHSDSYHSFLCIAIKYWMNLKGFSNFTARIHEYCLHLCWLMCRFEVIHASAGRILSPSIFCFECCFALFGCVLRCLNCFLYTLPLYHCSNDAINLFKHWIGSWSNLHSRGLPCFWLSCIANYLHFGFERGVIS